ncbi:hypothetical protein L6R49_08350 [Myxococcota bacterium]|nr:hypothetical protein [Myxococcota bacterium]
MTKLPAYLQNGRLVLDEDPAPSSDRPPLHLVMDDEGDDPVEEIDLDEEELDRLEAVIEESIQQLARGEGIDANEALAQMWALHQ